jgi:oligopeptide transport system ATP-binding protein
MTTKRRVLQAGLGNRGGMWASLIADNARAELAGVVDVDPARFAAFAAKHPGVACFAALDEAIAVVRPDVVLLVTPPDGHLAQASAAIAAGIPLLCEKPLAADLQEAATIVRLARDAGLPLTVGLNFRYLPTTLAIRDLVARRAFGEPGFGQFTYQRNRDGMRPGLNKYPLAMRHPMMLEQSIHHLDLIRFAYGREVMSVMCRTWNPAWSMYAHDANVSCLLTLEGGLEADYLGTWTGGWNELEFEWRTDCAEGVIIQRELFDDLATARMADAALTPVSLAPCVPFVDDTRCWMRSSTRLTQARRRRATGAIISARWRSASPPSSRARPAAASSWPISWRATGWRICNDAAGRDSRARVRRRARGMSALLEIANLEVHFASQGQTIRAVDDVSFVVKDGETLGVVGESGSGKSMTALAIMGLTPQPAGRVRSAAMRFGGRELTALSRQEMLAVRGRDIAMIFQDPMTSLNPVLTIGRQITEVLEVHLAMSPTQSRARAIELLTMVGIPAPDRRLDEYPHRLSGGMRQRAMIAMAMACRPKLLIADEPTTALDVTIQAQILDLISSLQRELGMAVIMITHDLGVVAGMADRVAVMYAGRIVEEGPTESIFARPRMPYTAGLLRSLPRIDQSGERRLTPIRGLPPETSGETSFCRFAPRCDEAFERCLREAPPLAVVGAGHRAACWLNASAAAEAAS